MIRRLLGLVVAAAMTLGTVQVVGAQSASDFDVEAVVAACTEQTGNGCLAAVQAYVAAVKSNGFNAEAVDDLIVQLVVALGENASQLPPAVREQIADVIVVAAAEMNDPARAEQVAAVARDVEAGIDVTPEIITSSPA